MIPRGYALFLVVGVAVSATAASWAPLATYVLTLATFGVVHVFVELRYVDRRFATRLPRRLTSGWLLVLGLIVLLRIARIGLDLDPALASALEVALVAGLALAVLPVMREAGPWRAVVVLLLAGALLYGAWVAPIETLVVLALLHNATPVAFLAERLRGRARTRAMCACVVGFVAVPVAIASGLLPAALERLGFAAAAWDPLGAGALEDHLGVFVPSFWPGSAVHLFAAAVYLQCLHYMIVIRVLPILEPTVEEVRRLHVRWPRETPWRVGLVVAAAGSVLLFAVTFHDARLLYGLIALVHAWIEVPVLLAALAPLPETA